MPTASQGGAMGMLDMLQEDAAGSDGRWGYGGYGGSGGSGYRAGGTVLDGGWQAALSSDRAGGRKGSRGSFPGSGEGGAGAGHAARMDAAGGGAGAGAAKRRGGDLSSPQIFKKGAVDVGHVERGAGSAGADDGLGTGSQAGRAIEQGSLGADSPRRALFGSVAGAAGDGAQASNAEEEVCGHYLSVSFVACCPRCGERGGGGMWRAGCLALCGGLVLFAFRRSSPCRCFVCLLPSPQLCHLSLSRLLTLALSPPPPLSISRALARSLALSLSLSLSLSIKNLHNHTHDCVCVCTIMCVCVCVALSLSLSRARLSLSLYKLTFDERGGRAS